MCDRAGSCSDVTCAGLRVDANAICDPPYEWTCPVTEWDKGDCDCGCGITDVDCADATAASSDSCGATGSCAASDCATIHPNDNAVCRTWTCEESWLSDGDCDDALATSCDYCETGSCADITCQGLDPNDNAVCTGP